jgi:hypothetical protein
MSRARQFADTSRQGRPQDVELVRQVVSALSLYSWNKKKAKADVKLVTL